MKKIDSSESSVSGQNPLKRFAHGWRALRHRNFRLFFSGQSISLIGTWMTRVATSWLVYRLTRSALLLGVVGFAGQIPTFLLAPFAGVLVDRLNRRKMLIWTQALAGLQSLALAGLTIAKVINRRRMSHLAGIPDYSAGKQITRSLFCIFRLVMVPVDPSRSDEADASHPARRPLQAGDPP